MEGGWRGKGGGNGPLDCATGCANRCAKVCQSVPPWHTTLTVKSTLLPPKSTGRSLIAPPADDGISLSPRSAGGKREKYMAAVSRGGPHLT